MCMGDDRQCPDFHEHHAKFKSELNSERRSFLKSSFAASGAAAAMTAGGISLVTPALAQTALLAAGKSTGDYTECKADIERVAALMDTGAGIAGNVSKGGIILNG